MKVKDVLENYNFVDGSSILSHMLQCAMTEMALSDGTDVKKLTAVKEIYESISDRAVLMEKLKLESSITGDASRENV